jgi:hypothetical protein
MVLGVENIFLALSNFTKTKRYKKKEWTGGMLKMKEEIT